MVLGNRDHGRLRGSASRQGRSARTLCTNMGANLASAASDEPSVGGLRRKSNGGQSEPYAGRSARGQEERPYAGKLVRSVVDGCSGHRSCRFKAGAAGTAQPGRRISRQSQLLGRRQGILQSGKDQGAYSGRRCGVGLSRPGRAGTVREAPKRFRQTAGADRRRNASHHAGEEPDASFPGGAILPRSRTPDKLTLVTNAIIRDTLAARGKA